MRVDEISVNELFNHWVQLSNETKIPLVIFHWLLSDRFFFFQMINPPPVLFFTSYGIKVQFLLFVLKVLAEVPVLHSHKML